MRRGAEGMASAIQPFTPRLRKLRELIASELEKLKARGACKDAANLAFELASAKREIERLENVLEANARWIEMEDAFEAQVDYMAKLTALAADGRRDTVASARAGGGQGDAAAPARAGRGMEEIAADIAAS